MKKLIILLLVLSSIPALAQHKIGVRAGLNYSKFIGELEQGESYGVSGGFHFGINYTYELNDIIGFRGELLYIQRGSKQDFYSENNYQIIKSPTIEKFVEFGEVDLNLELSNAYFAIPLTVQVQLNRKIELFGGMSIDFLVGPSGRGKLDFTSNSRMDDIFFVQSYDHKYGSDRAGEFNTFISESISIIVDGDKVSIPKVVGAYYNFDEAQKTGKRFKSLDAHIILGGNYFINTGFYIGARLEYGLADITNNAMDFSLTDLDGDENFIFREDRDRSVSLSVSFGFKF